MKRRSFLLGLASALAIPAVPAIADDIVSYVAQEDPPAPLLQEGQLTDDAWNHVALVRDDNELRCYLNGKEVSNIAGTEMSLDEQGLITLKIGTESLEFPTSARNLSTWFLGYWVKPVSGVSGQTKGTYLDNLKLMTPATYRDKSPKPPSVNTALGKIPFLAKFV